MEFLYMLLGLAILIVADLLTAAKKHKADFNIVIWMLKPVNYLYILLSLLSSIALAVAIVPPDELYLNWGAIKFDVLILGYVGVGLAGSVLLKKVMKLVVKE